MARPTHVPKFGNWDANDHVPFTKVFESARVGKGQKIINPNDPAENPEAFRGRVGKDRPPYQPPVQKINNNFRARLDRRSDTEEDDDTGSTFRDQQNEPPGRRMFGESMQNRTQGETKYQNRQGPVGLPPKKVTEDAPRRNPYPGVVSDNSISESEFMDSQSTYQSPSPSYQGRLGKKTEAASPGWERKTPAEGGTMFAPATPGRSRFRSNPEETPDRSPPLPRFGAWNDKDPSSGEGFTVIFNNARNEKKAGGPVRIPTLQSESPARVDNANPRRQPSSIISQHKPPSMWRCCFCDLSSE